MDSKRNVPRALRAAQFLFAVMSVPMLAGGAYFGFFAGDDSVAAPIFGSMFVVLGALGLYVATTVARPDRYRARLAYGLIAAVLALDVVKFAVYHESANVVSFVLALVLAGILMRPGSRTFLEQEALAASAPGRTAVAAR